MRQAIILLTCGAAVLLAGDPWKDKKSADWTDKDSAKVLTDSPWAKTVYAEISGGMGGGRRGGGGSVGVDGGGGRRGGGGGGGGATGSGGLIGSGDGPGGGGPDGPPGPSGPKVTVRWESSDPLLEALSKVEYSLTGKLREWSKQYYIITAAGMPVRVGGGGRQRPGTPPQGEQPTIDPKQMMDRFIQQTALKRKGKDSIAPERIEIIRVGDAMVPMFFFPRKEGIIIEDKDVTFESAFGPVTVKSKFNLKDMQYDGKLAL